MNPIVDKISDKITTEVTEATKEIVKDTAEELTKEASQRYNLPSIEENKELHEVLHELVDDTRNYLMRNRNRFKFIIKHLLGYVLLTVDQAKKDAIHQYHLSKQNNENIKNIKDESKIIIIDARTSEEKLNNSNFNNDRL